MTVGTTVGGGSKSTEEGDRPTGLRRFRPADWLFAVTVSWSLWWYLQLSDDLFFQWDDWIVAARGGNSVGLVEPHNGHLSVLPLLAYRLLFRAFELDTYLPFRLLAITSLAALAVALYLLTRARLGAAPALVFAMVILWNPEMRVTPFLHNFHIALLCGVVCAAMLPSRSHRADLVIFLSVGVGLATSGVGVAVAAACVSHSIISGFRLRRWLAAGLPTTAWVGWWVVYGDHGPTSGGIDIGDQLSTVAKGVNRSFAMVPGGAFALGPVVLGTCGVLLIWRWLRDRPSARTQVAWMVALVAWWAGLALSREGATDSAARYAYVGCLFVLLSVIPAHRSARVAAHDPRLPSTAAAAALVVLIFVENSHGIRRVAANRERFSAQVLNVLVEIDHAPAPLPDSQRLPKTFARRTVGDYQDIVDRLGPPAAVDGPPDELLVRHGALAVSVESARFGSDTSCSDVSTNLPIGSTARVRSGPDETEVLARRYGSRFVELRTVPSGAVATITTDGESVDATPWDIRFTSACLVDA